MGFDELAPNVREAAYGDDFKISVTLAEGAVSMQTVALKVATEGCASLVVDEDLVEAGVSPAFVPVEKWTMFRVVIDPEVSGGCFAFAWLKAVDGCFVCFEVRTLAEFCSDELVER